MAIGSRLKAQAQVMPRTCTDVCACQDQESGLLLIKLKHVNATLSSITLTPDVQAPVHVPCYDEVLGIS